MWVLMWVREGSATAGGSFPAADRDNSAHATEREGMSWRQAG